METTNLLILLFIGLFLALWNAYVIEWGLSTNLVYRSNMSKLWHRIGFLIRAALACYVTASYGLFYGWLSVIVLWQLYDVIINLARKMPAFYVDEKTRKSKMSTVTWIAKAGWFLGGLAFLF
jgi:hypothetical protein